MIDDDEITAIRGVNSSVRFGFSGIWTKPIECESNLNQIQPKLSTNWTKYLVRFGLVRFFGFPIFALLIGTELNKG